MDNKKLLGKRIRELRKKRGLKQEQLAEMIGVEPASICNIENAYNYPSFQNLEKITCALGVDFMEIFNYNHHKEPLDLLLEINKILKNNPDRIKGIYRILKAIV